MGLLVVEGVRFGGGVPVFPAPVEVGVDTFEVGEPFLGILPTTLPGRSTNDSVPDGLGVVPSRFVAEMILA